MTLILRHGRHQYEGDLCLVEAEVVHTLGRETADDSDPTICQVVAAMASELNDAYPESPSGDEARTKALTRFLGRLAHTKASAEVELAREYLAVDWLVRVFAPAWLDFAEVDDGRRRPGGAHANSG